MGQINADQALTVGRNALYFEDYVLSIQYFNRAIQAKPYLAQPYFYRAIAKINLEDYTGAEQDATHSIELNPFITDAWEVRGVARQNLEDYEGAVEDYKHALELLPHNRQLLFNMALAQLDAKMLEGADSTFTVLLKNYPSFENGLLGRARLRLAQNDTVRALEDIDAALAADNNSYNGHAMKAELLMRGANPDFAGALPHMDQAVKLNPRITGLYINRAYIKYNLDDWYGAMDDYDYALTLEPLNTMARFNRGLLNMEVGATDKAIEDFGTVLNTNPHDQRARYNRAIAFMRRNDYKAALRDANAIVEAYPELPTGYLMRVDIRMAMGENFKAGADYDKAMALSKKIIRNGGPGRTLFDDNGEASAEATAQEMTRREFASLLIADDNTDMREEHNNSSIRGRVQDRNTGISPAGLAEITFYISPTEIKQDTYYNKDIDDLNATRQITNTLYVCVSPPMPNIPELLQRHFESIDDYNSYMANHPPRPIDYIGRGMEFMTLRDYSKAVGDFDRAIAGISDMSALYMMRAQARYKQLSSAPASEQQHDGPSTMLTRQALERKAYDDILADLDRAIGLAPHDPMAHYNRGVVLLASGNPGEAIREFDRAVDLKKDFAEAYFNRGYIKLQEGNRREGIADLSRAGELGDINAYNLIKRISKQP